MTNRPYSVTTIFFHSLAFFGLVLVLFASNQTVEWAGTAPTERNWVFARLDRDHIIGQTFAAQREKLLALQVLIFTPPTERTDPVTLRLRYADVPMIDLAVVTVPLNQIANNGPTPFPLPPVRIRQNPTAQQTTLTFTLEAPTLEPGEGITVMAGPDTYSDGGLLWDGTPRPFADLAFVPVYQRPWLDSFWPISQLADGKPGIAGWPPFYVLLAYAYFWLCLSLLLHLGKHALRLTPVTASGTIRSVLQDVRGDSHGAGN